jgi:hypothetical protein
VALEPSIEKPAIIAAIDPSLEKPAIIAAIDPSIEKPAIVAAIDPSIEKPAIVAAIDPSIEKPAIVAAIDSSLEKSAIVAAEDPPGEKPALAAKVPSREKSAIVAAKDPPSGEKPAIVAAKVREAYVHRNPTAAAATPTIPAIPVLCDGVRWIPNCQRGQCYENGDALQHYSLLYLNATPRVLLCSARRPQGFHRKLVNAGSAGSDWKLSTTFRH